MLYECTKFIFINLNSENWIVKNCWKSINLSIILKRVEDFIYDLSNNIWVSKNNRKNKEFLGKI